jgi:hypothetical protein
MKFSIPLLLTYKTQKLTKTSENNKAKGLTNVNQGVQIHNIWHSSQTFGLKLGGVSLLSRRPAFFMPSRCRLLFACASTSCTLWSRFEMRRTRVRLLGGWSLKYAFRSWQIFQTLSPAHGSQILLAFRLSWSLMLSCGTRLKVLFLSLHQISPLQLHHHLHRPCVPPLTLKLLLHSLCLQC